MRVVAALLEAYLSLYPKPLTLTYGFSPDGATTDVSALVRQLMLLGGVWGRDMITLSADISWCFDDRTLRWCR